MGFGPSLSKSIVEESFGPEHIAQGQDVTFGLRLNNMGTMGVSLDQSTHLQLFDGSDSIICYINDEINISGKITKKAVPLKLLLSIMEMLKRLSSFF